ncbi:fungal specific transcription factor domain-containing protein [Sarocladium implicatum]|nr:fungal specific transcription factor domain-containing protein [Sarocladium implicatum]
MSHQVDYLSHALLALAATHLTVHTNEDYTRKALHHRIAALNLVNKRLSAPVETITDADALLAAMCCLSSESALNTETMPEYMSLMRGSYLMSQSFVTPLHRNSPEKSKWNNTALEAHEFELTAAVQDQAKDLDLIQDFQRSVGGLRSVCKHDFEFLYQQGLWRAITALPTSSVEATKWFFFIIVIPNQLPSDDFISFTRKDNFPSQLLIVHMFMLDYLLGQTCIVRDRAPKFGGRKWAILGWIRQLARSLPAAYRDFAEFPLRFCDVLDACDSRYLFLP